MSKRLRSPAGGERSRALRFGRWLVRRPVLVLLLSSIAVAALAAGGRDLELRGDYRVFFSEGNPQLAAFDAFQRVYSQDDNVLLVLVPRGGDVFTPEVLSALRTLTDAAWQVPFSTRVDSLANFQHTRARGDDMVVDDLVRSPRALSARALEEIRAVALAEPRLLDRLVAPGGDAAGVNVTLLIDGADPAAFLKVAEHVRGMVEDLRQEHPEIDVYASGIVMLNHAFLESTLRDLRALMPLMMLGLVALIAFFLRSLAATAAMVALIALSSAAGLGAAGWLGIELTAPSALAPTLIMTLAVAGGMHLLITMRAEMLAGRERRAAVVETLRVNAQPILITSVTTAIGFASMRLSDAPPVRDLGTITAVGVLAAFAITMTTLPALLALLPLRFAPSRRGADADLMARLAEWVIARRRVLLATSAPLMAILGLGLLANELDDRFVRYFDHRIAFRGDTEVTMARLTGIYQVEYSVPAPAGTIADPDHLRTLERFAAWWRAQPEAIHVETLADTFKDLNQAMHGDDPAFYRLPEDRRLAAQYLLLYELSLPFGLDLGNRIAIDRSASRVTVTVGDLSSRQLREVAERGERWLRAHAPAAVAAGGPGAATGVGPAVMFAHLSERAIRSMIGGTAAAMVLISVCLAFALRSVRYGLISLIPNLVPAALGFGLWGLAVGQVGFGLSIVSAMTLGIVVDDTVHFLSKYLRARREHGLPAADAVRHTFRAVGPALLATSVVLVTAFAILSTSPFAQNGDMGRLSAITILLALLADLLLLPPLLLLLDRPAPAVAAAEAPPALATMRTDRKEMSPP